MNNLFKKIAYAFLTLFGVVSVVFFLFTILPGDPAQMILGQNETQEQRDLINQKYGFDLPLHEQYILYLNDLSPVSFHSTNNSDYTFVGHSKYSLAKILCFEESCLAVKLPYLRESFQRAGKTVNSVISETLPNTVVLAFTSICLALFLGVILGVFSALYKDQFLDQILQVLATLGMSLPSFFSAVLFAWLFAYVLGDLTGLNMTGSLYELDDFGEEYSLQLKNLILPAVVLGIRPLAVVIQLMRNSLLETFQQDYIRTAKAKGLSNFKIILNHALKNSLNPVITAISGWFASLLAGAVFVEYIFGWNGLGKEIVDALNLLDMPVIMGAVIVIATMFILINIFVDLIYAKLDPKVN